MQNLFNLFVISSLPFNDQIKKDQKKQTDIVFSMSNVKEKKELMYFQYKELLNKNQFLKNLEIFFSRIFEFSKFKYRIKKIISKKKALYKRD